MNNHDHNLAIAFDQQAHQFERAPIQTNPDALGRLVDFAALPESTHVVDCGCGPGLVAEAFLNHGCSVAGVDLSPEMINKAKERCASFGSRASFQAGSVFTADLAPGFGAAVSRYVIHHVQDARAFIARQTELVEWGGVVVACDVTTDPDPERAAWHTAIERARDMTHTRNLPPGELIDAFAAAGLSDISLSEESFELDFDEWFDRGTPSQAKAPVRSSLFTGTSRGFRATERSDGGITITCKQALVRGVRC